MTKSASLLLTALLASTGLASAAAPEKPVFVRDLLTVFEKRPKDLRPEGLKLGTFTLNGGLALGVERDDNIFAVPAGTIADTLLTAEPSFSLQSGWERHRLDVTGFLRFVSYADQTSPGTTEGSANTTLVLDAGPLTQIVLHGGYLRDVQDRTDPDSTGTGEPTRSDRFTARAGFIQQWAGGELRLVGEGRRFDFLKPEDDDRDRDELRLTLRLRLAASETVTPYAELRFLDRDFREPQDDLGFNRDTRQIGAIAGVRFAWGKSFRGLIGAGALRAAFDDPGFADFTTLLAEGELTWFLGKDTALTGRVDTSEAPTTRFLVSARLTTTATLRLEHGFTPAVRGFTELRYARDRFENLDERDVTRGFGLGLEVIASPGATLTASYRFTDRASDTGGESFERNAFTFSARFGF
jgi:hypothetical protein